MRKHSSLISPDRYGKIFSSFFFLHLLLLICAVNVCLPQRMHCIHHILASCSNSTHEKDPHFEEDLGCSLRFQVHGHVLVTQTKRVFFFFFLEENQKGGNVNTPLIVNDWSLPLKLIQIY